MIAVPKTGGNEHLQILAMLSQMLMDTDFKDSLINAQSLEEFMDLINQKEASHSSISLAVGAFLVPPLPSVSTLIVMSICFAFSS